ncbi:MAG: prepilin-type N-terminal cleavage/methylation domain-containing protein [Pseudomonadota bacterium]
MGANIPLRRPFGKGNHGGFTLIELAVVIVLLGILLGLAAPRFAAVMAGGVKAAARRMHGVVVTVHDKAALQKRRFFLAMETGSGRYWALATEPEENPSAEDVLGRQDKALIHGELPREVVFKSVSLDGKEVTEGTALAVFEPNGTCTATRITLAEGDGGGEESRLVVEEFTGRCRVGDFSARPGRPPEGAAPQEGEAEEDFPAGEDGSGTAPAEGEP